MIRATKQSHYEDPEIGGIRRVCSDPEIIVCCEYEANIFGSFRPDDLLLFGRSG